MASDELVTLREALVTVLANLEVRIDAIQVAVMRHPGRIRDKEIREAQEKAKENLRRFRSDTLSF